MLEMTTKLNELNGAGPDDRPTLPKEYDVYQKIWTEILEKIKVIQQPIQGQPRTGVYKRKL